MAQETKQPAVSADKIIQGDQSDLAAALADTQGEGRGKITFVDPGGEEAQEAKKPAKKKAAAKVEVSDDDEGTGSGILDAMAALSTEQAEGDGEKGTPDANNKGADGQEGEEGSHEIEGFEEVDTNIPVGPQIKQKFKRFKANEKALKTAHAESTRLLNESTERNKALEAELERAKTAQPEGLEESEAYKAVLKRAEEAEGLVERLRLEESPRFKDRFDNKIAKGVEKAKPFIKAIADEAMRAETVKKLDVAVNIAPGADNDPDFYAAIAAITDQEHFPAHLKTPLFSSLVTIRQLVNERHDAVSNWKETVKENGGLDLEGVRQRTSDATSLLKGISARYEEANADRLNVYRSESFKEIIDYDAEVGEGMRVLQAEVPKSIEAGGPSPNLLALAHRGVELGFQVNLNERMASALKESQAEVASLKKQLEKVKNGGTGGGSGGGTPGTTGSKTEKNPEEYRKGSGILETMAELDAAE